MENEQLTNAIMSGLNIMSSEDIRVPASEIEALANFKDILKAILNGQLILATPDRVLPEGVELPKEETISEEDSD
jgi:hypothetical protein